MSNYCFLTPILPGGEELMREWIRDESINNVNHDRVFQIAGITREQIWIQRTPMGDFAVASFEVEDPEKAFEVIGKSTDPWAAKFRNLLFRAHGVDITHPLPMNEQVANWDVTEKIRV